MYYNIFLNKNQDKSRRQLHEYPSKWFIVDKDFNMKMTITNSFTLCFFISAFASVTKEAGGVEDWWDDEVKAIVREMVHGH